MLLCSSVSIVYYLPTWFIYQVTEYTLIMYQVSDCEMYSWRSRQFWRAIDVFFENLKCRLKQLVCVDEESWDHKQIYTS